MDTELEYAEWTLQSKEIVSICREEDFGLSTLFASVFFHTLVSNLCITTSFWYIFFFAFVCENDITVE